MVNIRELVRELLAEAYALSLDYVNRWLDENVGIVDRIVVQTGTPSRTNPRVFIMTRRTLKTLGMFIEEAEDVSGSEIEVALLKWHTSQRGMWFVTTMGEEQIESLRGGRTNV